MTKARELAELGAVYDSGALSNRNLIINGAMQVAQRGTSETGITASEYADAPDRFKIVLATAGTWTASQSTTSPDGFSTSYKLNCTTADASLASTDVFLLKHVVEAQNLQGLAFGTSSAKQVTLSFWVRSNKTGTYVVEIDHDDATVYMNIPYTIDAADTWEYKTLTFSGNSATSIANDNGAGLEINWWLAAGSNYTSGTRSVDTWQSTQANRVAGQTVNLADNTSNEWYLTGVQLEVGSEATPFEHRSYGDEIARCQRYYEKSPSGQKWMLSLNANNPSLHFANSNIAFKAEKRSTPTITQTSSGNSGTGINSLGTYGITTWGYSATGSAQAQEAYFINSFIADSEL